MSLLGLASVLLGTVSSAACPQAPEPSSLLAQAPDLPEPVLELALTAWSRARCRGEANRDVLAVIDFSRPSTERRLWVFDLEERSLLFHELVAHGRTTGEDRAHFFSNEPRSLASSLGVFSTGSVYQGKHGPSLQLNGLEAGVNDRAAARSVVIHGAEYVNEAFAHAHGRLGRSWGCPAVDARVAPRLVDALKGGAVVFAYYPDPSWLGTSPYLR